MYQVGQFIIYAQEGVCRVEAIGPVDIKGARQDMLYYTLRSLWHQGKVYAPVESEAFSRPVITEAEASALLADIPNAPVQVFENHNPRVLGEIWAWWTSGASSRPRKNSAANSLLPCPSRQRK